MDTYLNKTNWNKALKKGTPKHINVINRNENRKLIYKKLSNILG
jgi:hypothetical protein